MSVRPSAEAVHVFFRKVLGAPDSCRIPREALASQGSLPEGVVVNPEDVKRVIAGFAPQAYIALCEQIAEDVRIDESAKERWIVEIVKAALPLHATYDMPDWVGVLPKKARFEIAKAVVAQPYAGSVLQALDCRIQDRSMLRELARICAKEGDVESAFAFIQMGVIEDEEERIEMAKKAVSRNSNVVEWLDQFHISRESALVEILKIAAAKDGELVSQCIQRFNIREEGARQDIAKVAISNDARTVKWLANYNIQEEGALIEILKIAAAWDWEAALQCMERLKIGEPGRIEIARVSIEQRDGCLGKIQQYRISADTLWKVCVDGLVRSEESATDGHLCALRVFNIPIPQADRSRWPTLDRLVGDWPHDAQKELAEYIFVVAHRYGMIDIVDTQKALIRAILDCRDKKLRPYLCWLFAQRTPQECAEISEKAKALQVPHLLLTGFSAETAKRMGAFLSEGKTHRWVKNCWNFGLLNQFLFALQRAPVLSETTKGKLLDLLMSCKDLASVIQRMHTLLKLRAFPLLQHASCLKEPYTYLKECLAEVPKIAIPAMRGVPFSWDQYQQTFGRFRDPEAFIRYCVAVRKQPVGVPLARFARDVIEGKLHETRYETAHLTTIFENQPALKAVWIEGERSQPLHKGAPDGWTIEDTDAAGDLFLCGTEVPSCQSVDGGEVNECLLAYCIDGKNRLLAVKNEKGQIVARAILRLLWDGERKAPVLFLERTYALPGADWREEEIVGMAKRRAAALRLPLLSKDGSSTPYPNDIVSLGGPAPFEWVDAIGGPNGESQHHSRYTIQQVYVLQPV